jgi:enamine deaminase RidA (YjgF/YER057c/UK114 family)
MEILQPPNWPRPNGFPTASPRAAGSSSLPDRSAGTSTAHQSSDFSEQVRQALKNIIAVLAASDGKPERIVRT